MNTIELMLEALKAVKPHLQYEDTKYYAKLLQAIAAGEAELERKPTCWLYDGDTYPVQQVNHRDVPLENQQPLYTREEIK